jgi:hypothetical protein
MNYEEYLKKKYSTFNERDISKLITALAKKNKVTRSEIKEDPRKYLKGYNISIREHYNCVNTELIYDLLQNGDIIQINSPEEKELHKKKLVVTKKRRKYVKSANFYIDHTIYCSDRNGTSWRLSPIYIMPTLERMEAVDVDKTTLTCIRDPKYRPGYDDKTIFKIIWVGQKYVRVEPINPKFEISKGGGYNPNGDKPGDGIFQYNEKGKAGRRGWKKNCYNLDIPKYELVPAESKGYDKEVLDVVEDFVGLGF